MSDIGINYLVRPTTNLARKYDEITAFGSKYDQSVKDLVIAEVAHAMQAYIAEASRSKYHRRLFGLRSPKMPPPPLPKAILDLSAADAIEAVTTMASAVKSTRRETLDARVKTADGSIKLLRGAAGMFLSQFDPSSLPEDLGELAEGLVDIYEANSSAGKSNADLVQRNLKSIVDRQKRASEEASSALFNATVDFVGILRRTSHDVWTEEADWRSMIGSGQSDRENHSYQRHVEAYSKLRFRVDAMLSACERTISQAGPFGEESVACATFEYPEVSATLTGSSAAGGLDRYESARLLASDRVRAKELLGAVRLSMAEVIQQKLYLDIEFTRGRRRGANRPPLSGFRAISWYLSHHEQDPTLELKTALEGLTVYMQSSAPERVIAPVAALDEEIRMFEMRLDIHKYRHPEFSDSKLRESIQACIDALEDARSETKDVAVFRLPQHPTYRSFTQLAKQIGQSRNPELNPSTPEPGFRTPMDIKP